MNDLIVSFIRTAIPSFVGAIGAFLASKGINVSPEDLAGLIPFLTTLISSVFYLTARYLESKYPKAGFLLGVPKQPQYKEMK